MGIILKNVNYYSFFIGASENQTGTCMISVVWMDHQLPQDNTDKFILEQWIVLKVHALLLTF